ncbi:TetR/AcrR family transcriptional regulator [Alkalibacter rhizosphaerae]|uniref:TetR/AcrR family transcriptional regulator n=1 Tax=Alkalibacter rhizosphaerae TaxID=2815577 RepID=A0A974XG55_9FIRM|nr:TetR/AcrR family transcriptional regulator [Alkalibacter rhizosphaerae]QSX07683.1 TetR/AcrR family transcriptional regulator [Alkalibacter rhizosphaerae]
MAQHKVGKETKERIYQAAKKLFYENGYIETKVTDIIDLSETNKGSFYHHYENKVELGFRVFNATVEQHFNASKIAALEDSLVQFSLEIAIFWYIYFHDEKFRRFSSELNANDIIQEHDRVYQVCLENTDRKIEEKEFDLIRIANVALYKQLAVYFFDQVERYTFDEARSFYLRNLFDLFGIPQKRIEGVLEESLRVLGTMELSFGEFQVKATLLHK